ncbi:hypothetical protein I3843_09G144200 [Carya illinoinensis]|nr:hypothetical protein I3760_09G145300 [Carya illinoinensis]KAG7963949.1 hypothetical protein I3843_09G144200 [Carya illinoinensis]
MASAPNLLHLLFLGPLLCNLISLCWASRRLSDPKQPLTTDIGSSTFPETPSNIETMPEVLLSSPTLPPLPSMQESTFLADPVTHFAPLFPFPGLPTNFVPQFPLTPTFPFIPTMSSIPFVPSSPAGVKNSDSQQPTGEGKVTP